MPMITLVFNVCGVYLHKRASTPDSHGAMLLEFWAEDPATVNYDERLVVRIDELRNIAATYGGEGALSTELLQLDEERLKLKTVDGRVTGGIHINRVHWERARIGSQVAWPLRPDGRTYEYQEAVVVPDDVDDPETIPKTRYRGFHVKVDSVAGDKVTITMHHGGQSLMSKPNNDPIQETFSLDDFDPKAGRFYPIDEHALTTVDLKDPKRWEGALFIEDATRQSLGLRIPKLPPGSGT